MESEIHKELGKMLHSLLPSYMIPPSITILDKMPVNHSGKKDRRLLSQNIRQKAVSTMTEEKRLPSTATQCAMRA